MTTRPTSSLPGQTELWIRHALIREVAYRSIPDAQRRAVHASVGDWIAALAGDRREEFVDLLAHHYERAVDKDQPEDMRAKAVAALIEAGHGARRRAATDDAVQFADRALALARQRGRVPGGARAQGARAARRGPGRREPGRLPGGARPRARRGRRAPARARHAAVRALPGRVHAPRVARWAVAQIDEGLAGDAEQRDTFDVGALLIGRASMVPLVRAGGRRAGQGAPRRRAGDRDRRADRVDAAALARARGARLARRRPRLLRGERDRRPDARAGAPDARPRRGVRVAGHRRDLPGARWAFRGLLRGRPRGGGVGAPPEPAPAHARGLGADGLPARRRAAATSWPRPPARRPRSSSTRAAGRARWARSRSPATRSCASRRSTRPPESAPRRTSRRSACTAATPRSATAGSRSCARSSGSSAHARASTTASRCAGWSTASTTSAPACSSWRSRTATSSSR